MDLHQKEFDTRLKRIGRKHRKLAAGYVGAMTDDGLIVPRARRRRIRVPYAGIALLAIGIVGLKGIAYSRIGAETYDARVASLAQGSTGERIGAWVMQADPLTRWVAAQAGQIGI